MFECAVCSTTCMAMLALMRSFTSQRRSTYQSALSLKFFLHLYLVAYLYTGCLDIGFSLTNKHWYKECTYMLARIMTLIQLKAKGLYKWGSIQLLRLKVIRLAHPGICMVDISVHFFMMYILVCNWPLYRGREWLILAPSWTFAE